jgi:integrase
LWDGPVAVGSLSPRPRSSRSHAIATPGPTLSRARIHSYAPRRQRSPGLFRARRFRKGVAKLPEPINDIARCGYLSGWRRGEIVPLRWDAVDRTAREVHLRTSKNGQGRVLPLDGELWTLIERRWASRTVEQKDGTAKRCEFVFHRSGEPVVDFRKPWNDAFKEAKWPGGCFTTCAGLPCET